MKNLTKNQFSLLENLIYARIKELKTCGRGALAEQYKSILDTLGSSEYPIVIEQDLGLDYQDCGQWRSYILYTDGSNYKELINNATIEEVCQDGGTLNCYGIGEADDCVYDSAVSCIVREIDKQLHGLK